MLNPLTVLCICISVFLPQYLFHQLAFQRLSKTFKLCRLHLQDVFRLGNFNSFKIKYLMNTLIYEAFYILMYLNDFWYIYSSYLWQWEHWIFPLRNIKFENIGTDHGYRKFGHQSCCCSCSDHSLFMNKFWDPVKFGGRITCFCRSY